MELSSNATWECTWVGSHIGSTRTVKIQHSMHPVSRRQVIKLCHVRGTGYRTITSDSSISSRSKGYVKAKIRVAILEFIYGSVDHILIISTINNTINLGESVEISMAAKIRR